jgi:hypothetical protein
MLAFKEEMRLFKDEMLAFKEEMRLFKDEMLAFKEEMRLFKDEMLAFKEEMRLFKDEVGAFKDEVRVFKEGVESSNERRDREWRQWRRQLGELSNRMGTLVEDIVAPGIPTIFRRFFGVKRLWYSAQRVSRAHRIDRGRMQEFDYVVAGNGVLMVNETRSTVRPEDIPAFVALLEKVREFLPEADGRRVVGSLAGFSLDPSLVATGERHGLLMLGLGTGLMRVLNRRGFQPKRF